MMTGTGTPLSSVGVNSHVRTASSAAASSNGIERSTRASCTLPLGPMVASIITTPCTRADCAIGGYTGRMSLVFIGGLMFPPTRTGAAGGGGGGGGGGGAAANASIEGGTGSTSAASNGITINASTAAVCTAIETGTVYHCWLPTLTVGSTISRNISFGTGANPPAVASRQPRPAKAADYSHHQKWVSTKRENHQSSDGRQ